MRKFLLFFFLAFLLFSPSAFAWGPGAHLEYALHALANLSLVAPAIAALLKKYPHDFLYGNLAADITVGKKYAGDLHHCHHWDVALPLLDRAKNERQQAFIYGYLTHLAVDTVSHNYFVPYHVIKSFEAYTLRHTYWEMRFDLKMSPTSWDKLSELIQEDYSENDALLASTLKKALFSFKTNKRIFNGLLLLQRTNRWKKAAHLLTRRSTYVLTDADVQEFRMLCFDSALNFLKNPEQSKVLFADPAGDTKLQYAKETAALLKKYASRHLLIPESVENFIEKVRNALRGGLYQSQRLPEIYDVI